jgi:hypothetical protein
MAIENYLDNITSQHRDKPKFIGWLSSNLTIIDGIYNVVKSIDSNFDIDNAIGVQLDTLGIIVGRKRTLSFQPMNGFNPVLEDATYRTLLKAKVAMNNWDGTIPQVYQIWDNIFGDDSDLDLQIQDNQDMSFNAFITGYVDQIQQDLIQHGYIVPKPEGVRVNYVGRSIMDFSVYSGMVVSVCKSETINMTFDPIERINLNIVSRITVQQIKTENIDLSGAIVNYTALTNEDNNYIANELDQVLVF